ncbi:EamA family transporter [Antribacter gilvus]|uniref:EamA family transporter n=1 Tax=Antribacter gilvus TaxID=2304675 RepID=UPI000F76721E|nr:DMT family transporter [Antribacter gilvus]
MSAVTPDTSPGTGPGTTLAARLGNRRLVTGLAFALTSAVAFSLSGTLASGLFATGWSPGAVVLVRVAVGTLVVLPAGLIALRGRWGAVRRNVGLIVAYGTLAVAGAQFCYFSAVQHMQVGPALLIEYTAPAAVVVWFWLRHGQRPGPVTLAGAGLAALGLVLVLDLLSGAQLSPVGVAWSLGAMVGAATYFVINGDETTGLPPLVLAAGGLVVGTLVLGLLGLAGLMPLTASAATPVYAGTSVPWWLPLAGLGVVTAGIAYVTGIAAGRRLGSRLSSFVSLLEVVAAIGFAWLLLGQLPRPVQLVGGLLILAGVVVVRLGEERIARPEPVAEVG